MRKIYLIFPLLILLFAACKKDGKSPSVPDPQQPDTTGKQYTINFNVGIDAASTLGTGTSKAKNTLATQADLKTIISELHYYVLNENGGIISQVNQKNTDPNFGAISDTFYTGTFTVIAWGVWGSPPISGYEVRPFGRDFFYKKTNITISSTTSSQQTINIDRVVGQLQVKILDAVPANALGIRVTVYDDCSLNYITGQKGAMYFTTQRSLSIPDSLVGKTNVTISTQIMNTIRPLSVYIECSSKSGGLLTSAVIRDVTFQPNKRTILSGNLFSDPQGTFGITFNETWDPDKVDIEF